MILKHPEMCQASHKQMTHTCRKRNNPSSRNILQCCINVNKIRLYSFIKEIKPAPIVHALLCISGYLNTLFFALYYSTLTPEKMIGLSATDYVVTTLHSIFDGCHSLIFDIRNILKSKILAVNSQRLSFTDF